MSFAQPILYIRLTHTGQYADGRPNTSAVFINDLDVGYEFQNRKVPVYVPPGSFIEFPASSRSLLSFQDGTIRKFAASGVIEAHMFYVPESYTTGSLPPATGYPIGTHVWNTTESTAYWSTGSAWVIGKAVPSGVASGDLGGFYPAPTVVGLVGIPIQSGPPVNGDALIYNNITNQYEHSPITFGGGPPVGPASGDLGGLYPGPVVTGLQSDPLPATAPNAFLKRNSLDTAWEGVGYGSGPNTVCQGSDPRLSDSRAPNGAASGDLGGFYPSPTVTGIHSRPISAAAPVVGQPYIWDGLQWVPGAGTPVGSFNVRNISGNATAAVWDVIFCDTSGGAFTVTLPAAATSAGRPINVKKVSVDAFAVTVAAALGETIDAQSSYDISGPFNSMTVMSNGTEWFII